MALFRPLFLTPAMLVLVGCLDTGTAYYGPASIAYELPSEQLGEGQHAMPGHQSHETDGYFTGWSNGSTNWTTEWSEAAQLEIPGSGENSSWVLFDRSMNTTKQHMMVAIPWTNEEFSGDCGILARGASENAPDTRTLWAGINQRESATAFHLKNDGYEQADTALGTGLTPLHEETIFLMAEFAVEDATGTRKWVFDVPTDPTCKEYISLGGIETIVSSESGYHTLKTISDGSIASYGPVWQGLQSASLLIKGVLLEAASLELEESAWLWFDSGLAQLSPWSSTIEVLENVNLSGRIESLPLLEGTPDSGRICLEVPSLATPLTLDGEALDGEYEQATSVTIGAFSLESRYNGEEHQTLIRHESCADLLVTGNYSLLPPLDQWMSPSSPIDGTGVSQTHITKESVVELRSWRGEYSSARAWTLACEENGDSILIEHGNHPAGAWIHAGQPGPFVSQQAISWDGSILTLGGQGFGESAGAAAIEGGPEKTELPVFEWNDDTISIGLPAELPGNGRLVITLPDNQTFSVAL